MGDEIEGANEAERQMPGELLEDFRQRVIGACSCIRQGHLEHMEAGLGPGRQ